MTQLLADIVRLRHGVHGELGAGTAGLGEGGSTGFHYLESTLPGDVIYN